MKIKCDILPLFKIFISDTKSGARLKKDGSRISKGTITNYDRVYKNLLLFQEETGFKFRGCLVHQLNAREFKSEQRYWKQFYKKFTTHLYKRGCFDNYVGQNVKIIRTFVNYLRIEKGVDLGEFYKELYVRKEAIDILVLSPERLQFFITDTEFEESLTSKERIVKDIFVFGCTTGLRFSDIMNLTIKNFTKQNDDFHFHSTSIKTKSKASIKLPSYAKDIYLKYRSHSSKELLFPKMSLNKFNEFMKRLGEKAGYTEIVESKREVRGTNKTKARGKNRFCDKMSSHMMRRTSITTLLIMGMPEILVRKISGHKDGSKAFFRYVDFARSYFDQESEKAFDKLLKIKK